MWTPTVRLLLLLQWNELARMMMMVVSVSIWVELKTWSKRALWRTGLNKKVLSKTSPTNKIPKKKKGLN
jgi:hypothetical protein